LMVMPYNNQFSGMTYNADGSLKMMVWATAMSTTMQKVGSPAVEGRRTPMTAMGCESRSRLERCIGGTSGVSLSPKAA
jgi:hypothetical protein